jgi:predicted flavoprotein YhiN
MGQIDLGKVFFREASVHGQDGIVFTVVGVYGSSVLQVTKLWRRVLLSKGLGV